MSIHKPRTRVVFFRVSEEEFQSMEKACDNIGARSISDFARTASLRLIAASDDTRETLNAKLSQIEEFVERLQGRVRAMARSGAVGESLTGAVPSSVTTEEQL